MKQVKKSSSFKSKYVGINRLFCLFCLLLFSSLLLFDVAYMFLLCCFFFVFDHHKTNNELNMPSDKNNQFVFFTELILSLVKTCIVGIAPEVSVSFLSFFVLTLLSIATSNISNLLFLHVILDKHIETLLKWIHTAVSLKTRRNLI